MSYRNLEEIVHQSYSSKPKYSELMPGVPEDFKDIKTLGDLLKLNYKHVKIEEQLRGNLILKLRKGNSHILELLAMMKTSYLQLIELFYQGMIYF